MSVAIKSFPPEDGSYNFVLRQYNHDPQRQQIFNGYDETVQSRAIELDGEVAHTLFIRKQNVRDRAVKLGWIDETDKWNARKRNRPERGTPADRILNSLHDQRERTKSEILAATDIMPSEFRKGIAVLKKHGWVDQIGEKSAARYTIKHG